jgi:hypothetical protein
MIASIYPPFFARQIAAIMKPGPVPVRPRAQGAGGGRAVGGREELGQGVGLVDGVGGAEGQRLAAGDRGRDGVELDPVDVVVAAEPVGPGRVDGQVLRVPVAVQRQGRGPAQPRVGQHERAAGPDQLQLVAVRQVHAHVELGQHPAGQPHGGRQAHVDPARVADRLGADPLRIPPEQPRRAHAVAAEVQAGTAAEGRVAPDVAGRDRAAERGPDVAQPADRAVGHELPGQPKSAGDTGT